MTFDSTLIHKKRYDHYTNPPIKKFVQSDSKLHYASLRATQSPVTLVASCYVELIDLCRNYEPGLKSQFFKSLSKITTDYQQFTRSYRR